MLYVFDRCDFLTLFSCRYVHTSPSSSSSCGRTKPATCQLLIERWVSAYRISMIIPSCHSPNLFILLKRSEKCSSCYLTSYLVRLFGHIIGLLFFYDFCFLARLLMFFALLYIYLVSIMRYTMRRNNFCFIHDTIYTSCSWMDRKYEMVDKVLTNRFLHCLGTLYCSFRSSTEW